MKNPVKKMILFKGEKYLVCTGLLGVLMGILCLALIMFQGSIVRPQGDLFNAVSFNIALGLFILTTAAFIPLANFGVRSASWFRWILIIATIYCYGLETVQNIRGINPRFAQEGNAHDHIFGAIFGLFSILIIVCYIILAIKFYLNRNVHKYNLLMKGICYGMVSIMIGFASGIWMIMEQGRYSGATGDILWLHGLSFHGLQAIPLLALFIMKSKIIVKNKIRLIHIGGISWCLALVILGNQTFLGKSIFEPSVHSVALTFILFLWVTIFLGIMSNVINQEYRKINSEIQEYKKEGSIIFLNNYKNKD
ncbi:hypothetical protein [Fictibacillus sp. BK138]|uniref:hypothetical protein n=1 Tax=Fictibacillus sp. BK138 TaxID=2512121 RepID=UPI00102A227A|nr:hypothetical protein [Fictibacillus sp. BK138]RZT15524.1 hypothetical protein EV282_3728 [Fictibacillus sp. BK138]